MQDWDAKGYVAHAGYVAEYGEALLDLLAPAPGQRILDIGCGDGRLTQSIAEAGADVTGIDASADMVAAAVAKGLTAEQMDAQALPYVAEFDSVFTNAALHWMPDHPAVLNGVAKALKPGGRFVGEFGGHGNVAAIVTALVAVLDRHGLDGASRIPFNFPNDRQFAEQLEAAGFVVERIGLIPRATPLPTGMEGWLRTFSGAFLSGCDDQTVQTIIQQTCDLLSHSLRDDQGNWHADYVRLRFVAHKPG
ncbi:MAG: class I SAM-dependent methyltransferase [Alphaproteobacteria bacterium]